MSRFLRTSTILILLILTLGTLLIPNNSMFWLADASRNYMYARLFLAFILSWFLFFDAPPIKSLRAVFIAASLALTGWALYSTYAEAVQLLDGLAFAASGISVLVTTMEHLPENDYDVRLVRNIGAVLRPAFFKLERYTFTYVMMIFIFISIAFTRISGTSS